MRATLITKGGVPYGGMYILRDPVTGVEIKAVNFTSLLQRLYEVRRQNSAPAGPGLEQELEDWVCRAYPKECQNLDPAIPRLRRLNLEDVTRGTKVLLEVVARRFLNLVGLSESPLVTQAEADRRAATCQNCDLLTYFAKPCAGLCPELATLVNTIKGAGNKTVLDGENKVCSICACVASASVWVQKDIQAKSYTPEMQTHFNNVRGCWKGTHEPANDQRPVVS